LWVKNFSEFFEKIWKGVALHIDVAIIV
jgi:hypothetical protein